MTEPHFDTARRLLPLIDLTSLNDAHDDDVAALCSKARTPHGAVAAVCSWPVFVSEMARRLAGTGVAVAAVVNFPQGLNDRRAAVAEARGAVESGAGELDLVWPYLAWLSGEREAAIDLVTAVKDAARTAKLKVILETGALSSPDFIAQASADVIAAGADILKTSTGKIAQGASLDAAGTMLEAIRASGRDVGLKVSGGIRSVSDATGYFALADEVMGDGWVTPYHFRIGASRLLDDVLGVLSRAETDRSSSGRTTV